jgi:protoporphyrinogen oxidase
MDTTEFLVLGAGATGLGVAIHLERNHADWHLIEAKDHFGGLAASFKDKAGFTWDYGGHVQFSHYEEFDRWMDIAGGRDGWFTHHRESWIRMRGQRIPYPLQNNLHRLDPQTRWSCIEGFLKAHESQKQLIPLNNFDDWVNVNLGEAFNELFMRPYIFKVWGYPSTLLDYTWIDERVAMPRLSEVLKSICLNQDNSSWGPNHTFRYPKQGGMGSIWNAIGRRLPPHKISLSQEIVTIDATRKVVVTSNGQKYHYNSLISTIPLDDLLRLTSIPSLSVEIGKLKYSATNIIGVGLSGAPPSHLRTTCWMYFPEANSPYYRVTVFSNYSPYNVAQPGKQWSLLAEVTESEMRPIEHRTLIEDTLKAMKDDDLIEGQNQIVSTITRRVTHGYPTPFLGRDVIVDPILDYFEDKQIYSRGRFGAWKYEVSNQDHSFMQGIEIVQRLLYGSPEQTLHYPSRINSKAKNPFPYPQWDVSNQ